MRHDQVVVGLYRELHVVADTPEPRPLVAIEPAMNSFLRRCRAGCECSRGGTDAETTTIQVLVHRTGPQTELAIVDDKYSHDPAFSNRRIESGLRCRMPW